MPDPDIYRKFQLTNLGGNNNKFYEVRAWKRSDGRFDFESTFGRVGNTGQKHKEIGVSRGWIEGKINEKERKGYKELILAQAQIVSGTGSVEPELEQIATTIMSEAGNSINTYLNTTVDALSKAQIADGRLWLQRAMTDHQAQDQANLEWAVQQYYNTIPTILPHRIKIDEVVNTFVDHFDDIEDRLNQLEAALASNVIVRQGSSNYGALGCKLRLMARAEDMHQWITKTVLETSKHGYTPRIHNIYEVEIESERKAFEDNTFGAHQKGMLFHGTNGGNVAHILRSGLMCPSSPSNGRMFGHGVYFANTFSKSANYASSKGHDTFCFMAQVSSGDMYLAPENMPTIRSAPGGYHSVWGKANHTKAWGGRLQFDEFIVYRNAQSTIRYLITFGR